MTRRLGPIAFVLLAIDTLAACGVRSEPPMTTLAPKSDLAQWIYNLLIEVSLWDGLILAIVLVSFFLAVFVFSTRAGEAGPPSSASSDLRLEVAYTIGPALVLLMISIPTIRTIFRSQPAHPPRNALLVKVTAHQWWWEFHYPDADGISTANELHIPANRPISLQLQSGDVIHSFWVPQLGGKRDVVPGQINQLTFIANVPGVYLGQCAEFCGLSHANMRFRVFVDSAQEFAAWQKAQLAEPGAPPPTDQAAADGARIFANSPCTSCHMVQGISKGYTGPNLSHFGSRTTLAAGVLRNTPDNVEKWIEDPQAIKPGAQMPPLGVRGKPLDDLTAYIESLK